MFKMTVFYSWRQFDVRVMEMSGLKAQNHKHDHFNSIILLTILDVNNIISKSGYLIIYGKIPENTSLNLTVS